MLTDGVDGVKFHVQLCQLSGTADNIHTIKSFEPEPEFFATHLSWHFFFCPCVCHSVFHKALALKMCGFSGERSVTCNLCTTGFTVNAVL